MKHLYLTLLSCFLLGLASAQERIVIVKSGSSDSSFDFSGFSAGAGAAQEFYQSFRKNLTMPAMFKEVAPSAADFQVRGSVVPEGGNLSVTVELVERGSGQRKFGKRYSVPPDQVEGLARMVSDEINEMLTGRPGFASKRIVFVGQQQGQVNKEIYAMYPDGGGMIQLTRDRAVVLGPEWAPNGQSITYTSFRSGFPDIYEQRLNPPGRRKLSSSSGMNSGGAISPDGRKIALILSKDGKPELYVKSLTTGVLTRLTNTRMTAKSSPSWSPDGRQIVFVSGHQGLPHLYVIGANGGTPKRVTNGGGQNLSPDWGDNGLITFTRRRGGLFQIAVLNPANGDVQFVSPPDADYEDPSWAADGYHLVASRTIRGQSSLYLLDMQGKGAKSLLQGRGNWYMPDWRP
ncbi:hypothetical protein P3T73_10475 [Kiritimatiellota bacterium B12222]|nr:hypothetical protein P3T73_10475 [Kiritimatiellota bacterium B12222]